MKVIQRRDVIRRLRDRFNEQYKDDAFVFRFARAAPETVAQVKARLALLDLETCSVGDVDKAMGSTGWADMECDECGTNSPALVHLGSEPDYDARWQDLCADCIAQAARLLATTETLK